MRSSGWTTVDAFDVFVRKRMAWFFRCTIRSTAQVTGLGNIRTTSAKPSARAAMPKNMVSSCLGAAGVSIAGDDLGEYPADNCELCGTPLRHIFLIQHPNWGALSVGTDCHDRLTGTTDAREFHGRSEKLSQKLKRFVSSPRWEQLRSGELAIEQGGIWLRITPHGLGYRVLMDAAVGKAEYPTVLDAKMKAFEVIESGAAAAYLDRRRLKAHAKKRALRLA